ncbi:MAG TPA: tetratricopeptide repeat protein [Phycisphaerae bacterium]|nr:tetratricopeptide repeat protein [Phycisphaerae bacterium]
MIHPELEQMLQAAEEMKHRLHYEQALRCLEAAAERFSDVPEAHVEIGSLLLRLDRVDEAAACFERALAADPRHEEAWFHRAIATWLAGDLPQAEAHLRKAVEIAPEYVEAWQKLADVLKQTDRPGEAAECYARMVAVEPDHALAHKELGDLHAAAGRLDEALAAYDQALEIDPEYADAQLGRARIAARANDWETVAREAETVLDYRPDHPMALVMRGMAYAAGGQPDRALACWERAARRDRHCRDAYQQIATLHALQGRPDRAWKAVRDAAYWNVQLDAGFLRELEQATGRRPEDAPGG